MDLRRVAANWLQASPGSMERCAARLGLTPPVLGVGRGGLRVGFMRALYEAMLGPRPARAPRASGVAHAASGPSASTPSASDPHPDA